MKKLIFIFCILTIFSCSREWENPLSIDEDLNHKPNIVQIDLDSNNNADIILDYAYSDSSTIILERKSIGGFEPINYIKKTKVILTDTSFDKEINHDFVYRVFIKKGDYQTSYSNEETLNYISGGLTNPQNLLAATIELQGIQLEWKDKSNYEESYKIEKDNGNGFNEIADLSSNTESYFDTISGLPDPPLQLAYRVKAAKPGLESEWISISTNYAGIGSPTNLEITNSSPSNFQIKWQDNSQIETGYSIERKKDEGNYSEIGLVGANISLYSDIISETGVYYFRVRALKDDTYSTYSNEITEEINSLIPTDELVAYYPFNGNANDESGNGYDGNVIGATLTKDRFGINNSAYEFNGNDDYIDLGDNFNDVNIPFTISVWIYRIQNESDHDAIFASENYPQNYSGFWLQVFETYIGIHYGDGGWPSSNSRRGKGIEAAIELNKWNHITATVRGSSDITIYVNGLDAGGNYSGSGGNMVHASHFAGIEKLYNSQYFEGFIDDILLYNRSLSDVEVEAIYYDGGWKN